MGHGRYLRGHGLVLLNSNTFCKMDLKSKMLAVSELAGSAFALIVAQVVLLNGFSFFRLCTWADSCGIGEVCAVGGPRTLCFFINWATCLKRLRTPALMSHTLFTRSSLTVVRCCEMGNSSTVLSGLDGTTEKLTLYRCSVFVR